ncbi:MAG TPA: Xaa-Pro peptidase family protein [Vicinamibacterales bacterium]|nr:Xaa-Pro peptidase family protein [Vicinamibacterales bacterium]
MQIAPAGLRLARQARLREQLRANSLDALLITSPPNVAYLTGLFASAAGVVVTGNHTWLITDSRYLGTAQDVAGDTPGLELMITPPSKPLDLACAEALSTVARGRAGFESTHVTVKRFSDLKKQLAALAPDVALEAAEGLVERLRIVKDEWELRVLAEAGRRLSDAAKCIIPKALAGMTERQVAALIEAELRRVGFDKPAFDTIVASGPNSAVPHYRAGDRVLTVGDLVVLDFGGMLHGYAVDLTRTITVGPAGERQRRLLEDVGAAQDAGFAAVREGVAASEIDRVTRDAMGRAGLADAFGHGTGHGLGLEVHERPRVAPFRADLPEETLQAGMVFTIEPGAYFPGWGGARIEDDAALTASGAVWLTDVPRF